MSFLAAQLKGARKGHRWETQAALQPDCPLLVSRVVMDWKVPPGSAFKLAMTKAAQAKVIPRNGPQILANAYLSSHTSHGEDKMLNRLFGKLVGLEIRSREAWADPSYCTVEDDLQL